MYDLIFCGGLFASHAHRRITMEFDWSVVHGLDRVPDTWDTGEVHSIEAHKYVCRENHEDDSVPHEEVAVSVMPGCSTRVDGEAA